MRFGTSCVVLLCVLTTVACAADGGTDRNGTVRRDSAGIEIVENYADERAVSDWTVDSVPLVDIGASSGAEEYNLHSVKGVVRLSDGRIMIAESAPTPRYDARLRYYDAFGIHIRTVRVGGDGPEEVRRISMVFPGDDDTFATVSHPSDGFSTVSRDVAFHAADGRVIRKMTLTWPNAPSRMSADGVEIVPWGPWVGLESMSPDRSFIARSFTWPELSGSAGLRWVHEPYFRLSTDTARVDTLFVPATRTVMEDPDARHGYRTPVFRRSAPPTVVRGNTMYWGTGDSFEIHAYDIGGPLPLGAPIRIIRYAPPTPQQQGKELRDRRIALLQQISRTPADSARVVADTESEIWLETLPAYQRLLLDTDGNLWVEHTRMTSVEEWEDDPNESGVWTVFMRSGALIGDVVMPPGLRVHQIGKDWVLGTALDGDDVEHVRMYRISKARGG